MSWQTREGGLRRESTAPPLAEVAARIEHMLSVGVGENPRESVSELGRLGARLIIQRAVEEESDAWLGRACYGRRLAAGSAAITATLVMNAISTQATKARRSAGS